VSKTIEISLMKAKTAQKRGDFAEAQRLYAAILQQYPQNARAQKGMQALVQHASPALPQAELDGLIALYNQSRLADVIARSEALLASYPQSAMLQNVLGIAHFSAHRLDKAAEYFAKAVELDPRFAAAWNNLAGALKEVGRLDEAIAAYRRALVLTPDDVQARSQMLHQQAHICDWDALRAAAAQIPALGVKGEGILPFIMLGFEDAPARHKLRSQRYAADNFKQQAQPVFARPAERPERIRIGYFSADFHNHATMYLMIRLFELHDRSRFSVHVYSYGPDSHDEMRQRLKAAVDVFHDVRDLGDREVAELARSEGLDIAIDLKGYTQAARLGILAWRPAPVQISYIGYPGTLGTDFIDYIVGDKLVIPDEQRAHYSESVIFMPQCYQVNDDRRIVSDRAMTRAELGLPEQGFVFCSFNNSYKITSEEFDIWMRLLAQVESSVLWLFKGNAWAQANLRKAAQKRGIDPERLVFAERMHLPEHLARQRLADLFLDTFNVNAHTTASDALWVGLPVVTRLGQGFAARVAGSLLNAVGLPELVTGSSQEYEALALALARDPQRLAAIRAKLAANCVDAPLFDTARFTRDLERAYDRAHALYREGSAPRDIILD